MRLILNLKNKELYDDDNKLFFTFEEWSYKHATRSNPYGTFILGDMVIDKSLIDDTIFEPNYEVLSFEGDYDGEGYISNLFVGRKIKYSEKEVIKALDLFLDNYLYKNPLDGGKGTVKGEIEIYFDYELEEFVIKLNKIVLEEE